MTEPSRPRTAPRQALFAGGGHDLPATFSAEPPPSRRRHVPRGVVFGVLGGVAVIATLSIAQLTANVGYDEAAEGFDDALRTARAHQTQTEHATAALIEKTDAGHVILDTGSPAIVVPDDAVAALASAVDDGEGAGAAAEDVVATELPPSGDKPTWFWELYGATAELGAQQQDLDRLVADLDDQTQNAQDTARRVDETGTAVLKAAAAAAAPFEAAHISARNDAVIALRRAAADAAAVASVDDSAATAYAALQTAAGQVVATEAEELAEKEGPLRAARIEIEAFARSLAPGVLLEFDWSPQVNGAGFDGSMGGYTTWWWDDPGRATIELSNSVAEQWPAERSKALVAHEVGHAISVKCQGMYDASTQDSIEKWATAWAISMGFTDDANGVWAYGYPPQDYIDAAAGCR
ncbi:hypothetical protein [Microbacterium algeriense]|uniref:hypothetical protein n=1 Tax=Microbacterium algeriense TaxID=2615184 RepID=UPI0022E6A6E7|nr:hypothetical protein [Microbacterium algeriense]